MGKSTGRFSKRFWGGLGFIAGTIIAFAMALQAGYSVLPSLLYSLAGGIGGAAVLLAFVAFLYLFYRLDISPEK